ncbi:MAG: aspartate 1-decarboxylase [Deltaproteobacteria bacterium]|jgi:aspartate 1-decarboxylase|nr:aspartate 1-decarboxylase [Deltaproteobacteria bacterium]
MLIQLLKAKIHRATVTATELDYVGSVTIDADLMDAAGLVEYEKILAVDVNNGARFESYCIAGPRGSGTVCVNGAAARLATQGDRLIVMAFCGLSPEEARGWKPKVVFVDGNNTPVRVDTSESHGDRFEDRSLSQASEGKERL